MEPSAPIAQPRVNPRIARPRVGHASRPTVGVLTFHRCINYGSYWQARCLVEGLRARGFDAAILDHDSRRINRAEWKCGLQPVLPARSSTPDSLRYAFKILRFSRARAALPASRRFSLEEPATMDYFDRIVVGSDEVWNLDHPWYGRCPLFFGEGVRGGRLVSYAASFGNHAADQGLDPALAKSLRRFSAISVRDDNSRQIIQAALGAEPELVLDPCLQFPIEPRGPWRGPREPFVAVYGHSFSESFKTSVRGWAQSRGYRLVSVGYRNDWADAQWLTAGPHDFAHFLARARAVATNFFHGCVFALRNSRPFACETMPYRANKIAGLLDMIAGTSHLIAGQPQPKEIDAALGQPIERHILERINRLRNDSTAYLDRALA